MSVSIRRGDGMKEGWVVDWQAQLFSWSFLLLRKLWDRFGFGELRKSGR